MFKEHFILTTLLILITINISGVVYSYLIINNGFLKSSKLQNRPHKIENFYNRLPLIGFNFFILLIVTGLGLYFFDNYIIKEYNNLGLFVFEILIVLLIDDIYFYFYHRLMHENKYIYRKIHKIHHRASTPFPSEYLYTHPLEWMIGMIGPFLGILLLQGVSIYAFWLVLIIRNIHELDIHSGLKSNFLIKYFPFSGTNEHHDLHHSVLDGNYSSSFTFWIKFLKLRLIQNLNFTIINILLLFYLLIYKK